MKSKDQPWVSNYPPLDAWLKKHGARCDWQLRAGGTDDEPSAYIEQYRFRNGRTCIVTVHSRNGGWDVATPLIGNGINESFADAELRMGLL